MLRGVEGRHMYVVIVFCQVCYPTPLKVLYIIFHLVLPCVLLLGRHWFLVCAIGLEECKFGVVEGETTKWKCHSSNHTLGWAWGEKFT